MKKHKEARCNIKVDFGAAGDGHTDDMSAFQAAMTRFLPYLYILVIALAVAFAGVVLMVVR